MTENERIVTEQDKIDLLQWILDHSSGGGSWRRVIIQKMGELEDGIKKDTV